MNLIRSYMMTVEGVCKDGHTTKGNCWFQSSVLDKDTIYAAVVSHCRKLSNQGIALDTQNCVVTFVTVLDQ